MWAEIDLDRFFSPPFFNIRSSANDLNVMNGITNYVNESDELRVKVIFFFFALYEKVNANFNFIESSLKGMAGK